MTVPFGMLGGTEADEHLPHNPYKIENSARFESEKKQHLTYTPKSGADRKTWTLSLWLKRGKLGTPQQIIGPNAASSMSQYAALSFLGGNDKLSFRNSAATRDNEWIIVSNSVLKDQSAWYHIVIVCDTSNTDETQRYRLYINGKPDYIWDAVSGTTGKYPPKNYDGLFNKAEHKQDIGASPILTGYDNNPFDGRMADIYFINGKALNPEEFGYFDKGQVWQPKSYKNPLVGHDFYLDFDNSSSNSLLTPAYGADDLTPINMGTDAISHDTPTNNVSTLSMNQRVNSSPGSTDTSYLKSANTTIGTTSKALSSSYYASCFVPDEGSYYLEYRINQAFTPTGNGDPTFGFRWKNGRITEWLQFRTINNEFYLSKNASAGPTIKAKILKYDKIVGCIVGVKITKEKVHFYLDGVEMCQADVHGNERELYFHCGNRAQATINFGDKPFKYPPRVYSFYETVTYTGYDQPRTVEGTFAPDWVMSANRTNDGPIHVCDSLRGKDLMFTTGENKSIPHNAISLNDTGFNRLSQSYNNLGNMYIAWMMRQRDGLFKMTEYTGDGSAARNVAHGLGTTPALVIIKSTSHNGNWNMFYHGSDHGLQLNHDRVQYTGKYTKTSEWTDNTISLHPTGMTEMDHHNRSGVKYIMYAWANNDEHMTHGTFTSTGSTDKFVYTGFKPKMIIMKTTSLITNSLIFDTARPGKYLRPSLVSKEQNSNVRLTDTGFILNEGNANTTEYAYFAFGDDGIVDTNVKTLSTQDQPDPIIGKPQKYFHAFRYNGTGEVGRLVSGLEFQPDLVWIKNQTVQNQSHLWMDSAQGPEYSIRPNQTWPRNQDTKIDYFTPNGWKIGTGVTGTNDLGSTFISYAWKKSPTAGFDIIEYTGTSTNDSSGNNSFHRELQHNVGGKVEFMIVKGLDRTSSWYIYHKDITDPNHAFNFAPEALGTGSNNRWGDLSLWNANQISLGNNYDVNGTTEKFVAYMWRSVPGFSKVGTYTGNSLADGPFLNLGFKPAFIMIKRKTGNYHWEVVDTARWPINGRHGNLNPGVGGTGTGVWGASAGPYSFANGYKLTNMTNNPTWNSSGQEYVYIAFAEHPFKNSTAR